MLGLCAVAARDVAAAIGQAKEALQPRTAFALACDALGVAIAISSEAARSPADVPKQAWRALLGHALCVAALAGSDVAEGGGSLLRRSLEVRKLLGSDFPDSAMFEGLGECRRAWVQVCDALQTLQTECGSAAADSEADGGTGLLGIDDRQVLCQLSCPVPDDLRAMWTSDSAHATAAADATRPPTTASAPSASLHVDLYSNPAARSAQGAVVAALPPARRVEALLSAMRAEGGEQALRQIVEAWDEEPSGCAAVVLRKGGDDSATWPLQVLAPVLALLVERGAARWQEVLARDFASEPALFDALWQRLCRGPAAASAGFWPWALGELCLRRLVGAGAAARDVAFAAHVTLRIGRTLSADLAAEKASAELEAALQGARPSEAAATTREAVRSSALRLDGLRENPPLAAVLLSLAELAAGGPSPLATETADEALECWLHFAVAVVEDSEGAAGEGVSEAVLPQLARVHSGAGSLEPYARAHLQVFLGGSGDSVEATALRACMSLRTAAEFSVASESLRRSVGTGALEPLRLLSHALGAWPAGRLAALVLHVLPVLLDEVVALVFTLALQRAPPTDDSAAHPRITSHDEINRPWGTALCWSGNSDRGVM